MIARFQIIVNGESKNEDETIRGIRAALKILGRRYGLRCETVTPIRAASEAHRLQKSEEASETTETGHPEQRMAGSNLNQMERRFGSDSKDIRKNSNHAEICVAPKRTQPEKHRFNRTVHISKVLERLLAIYGITETGNSVLPVLEAENHGR